jgi:aspartyl-tRNA(Asn)/glutamyl-tRNA(Gln) amidotransferase subunit A
MLKVIAGADPYDATTANITVPDYPALLDGELKGLRIGLSPDYFQITFPDPETGEMQAAAIDADIVSSVLRAADLLAKMGAEIVENVPMPHNRYGIPTYFVISRVEAVSNLHRFDGVNFGYRTDDPVSNVQEMYFKTRAQGFGVQPKLRVLMGTYIGAAQSKAQYYHRALRVRSLIRSDFDKVFDPNGEQRVHVLLSPTTPSSAFPLGNVYGDSVVMQYADQLTVAANHAGVPAISIPGGLDSKGLPIGIQFIGPDFSEATLFRVSKAYEDATSDEAWRKVKPLVLRELA